eukprot:COSAG01_NODE_2959_length_6793_cov_16.043771_3_plen_119_part_00
MHAARYWSSWCACVRAQEETGAILALSSCAELGASAACGTFQSWPPEMWCSDDGEDYFKSLYFFIISPTQWTPPSSHAASLQYVHSTCWGQYGVLSRLHAGPLSDSQPVHVKPAPSQG